MATAGLQDLMAKLEALGASTPKTPNLVVFPGRVGGRLIDNVKYAFLHFARNMPEIDARFLTFDRDEHLALSAKGLPSLLFGHGDSIETLARAGLVICDDFWWKNESPAYPLLARARTVQLWHGVPLKAIGFPEMESTPGMTEERREYLKRGYSGYDAVLSTSPFCTERAFGPAFAAREFPELGYPRNDAMLREPTADDMLNADPALYGELRRFRKKGGKTVFYMPTFRDEGYNPFSCGAVDLKALSDMAERRNALVVLKLHPYLSVDFSGLPERVRVADSRSDIYPLLPQCDVLLTDYSSIYFDFLLLDRGIVFYPFDFRRYVTANRALLFDYDAMTPGAKATEPAGLVRALEAALEGEDAFAPERLELRGRLFTHCDGESARRLGEYVLRRFVSGEARS